MGRTGWGLVVTTAALLALAGCKKSETHIETLHGPVSLEGALDGPPPPSRGETASSYIAVSYAYALKLPSAAVEATQRRHLETCAKLNCFVLQTTVDHAVDGAVLATTELRLPPQAVDAFTRDLSLPPAEITAHSRTAEDKTLSVLDLDKRLEAKKALRERLVTLLHGTASKNVHDLAELEQQIAEVQGDIESATAQRDHLRTITDTVAITIRYNGVSPAKTSPQELDWKPISTAFGEFGQTLIGSVASLTDFIAVILPWLPLALLIAWLLRRFIHQLRRRNLPTG
jgi:hypothetical protein